jgi:glycosyltransferase involved in cell wall biosynthesis
MRFLFASTHTDQQTGYSKIANNLLKELVKVEGLEVFHFGFQRHPVYRRPKIEGLTQYDAAANEDPKEQGFGFNCFMDYVKLVKPDVVMIYNDTLVVNRFLALMPEERPYKVWIYLDQVYKGCALGKIPEIADKVFVFSKEWKLPDLENQFILHHAPDPSVKHLEDEIIAKQKELLKLGDKTTFLNINRNSNRKRLDLTLQAFKLHLEQNPNSHLILVSTSGGHYNIPAMIAVEQIPVDKISFIDTSKQPLTDEQMNLLYNIADYGLNTADGEGWGLSTMEHAYLGKPQLVMDIGAYRSFLDEESSVFVSPTLRMYLQNVGFGLFSETSTPEAVAKGMAILSCKKKPSISMTWDTITQEIKSMLKTS